MVRSKQKGTHQARASKKTVTQGTKVKGTITESFSNTQTFDEEPAYVNYTQGKTISLGNFEFMRIDIGITLPCRAIDIPKKVTFLERYVGEELLKKAKEYDSVSGGYTE